MYDVRCNKLHESSNGEPLFETTEFTDCTKKFGLHILKCKTEEICCPKKTGGSKCVRPEDLIN